MESRVVGSFTAVSLVNPTHAGGRFSLLFRKFNLHDVKISRVRVNAYDDRHVLTLAAFERVGVVNCKFLVILVAHEILAVCANAPRHVLGTLWVGLVLVGLILLVAALLRGCLRPSHYP
jgi:hypothetical protein